VSNLEILFIKVNAFLKRFVQTLLHKSTFILAVLLLLPAPPCRGDTVFCFESQTTLFGLPKEDTVRKQCLKSP